MDSPSPPSDNSEASEGAWSIRIRSTESLSKVQAQNTSESYASASDSDDRETVLMYPRPRPRDEPADLEMLTLNGKMKVKAIARRGSSSKASNFKCTSPCCPEICQSRVNLAHHLTAHCVSKKFKCDKCSYSTSRVLYFRRHEGLHTVTSGPMQMQSSAKAAIPLKGRKLYSCPSPNCPAQFPSTHGLQNHASAHKSADRRFKCDYCSYNVSREKIFLKHKLLHELSLNNSVPDHSGSVPEPDAANSATVAVTLLPKYYYCSSANCPAIFETEEMVRRHLKKHDTRSQFECHICSYSAHRQVFLDRHAQLHIKTEQKHSQAKQLDSKPTPLPLPSLAPSLNRAPGPGRYGGGFKCTSPNCPEVFPGKQALGHHLKRHDVQESQFKCKHCSYAGYAKAYLQRHLILHKKAYMKEYRKTIQKRKGVNANAKKSAGATYNCSQCTAKYPSFNQLLLHKRRHSDQVDPAEMASSLSRKGKVRHVPPAAATSTGMKRMIVRVTDIPYDTLNLDKIRKTQTKSLVCPQASEALSPFTGLISRLTFTNFMDSTEKTIDFRNQQANCWYVQGESDSEKTTTIVACLLGIGYDFLLDLQETSTICGVDVTNPLGLVRTGESHGFVEVTLNLAANTCKELREEYGDALTIRRTLQRRVPKANSDTIQLSYRNDQCRISKQELKSIINKIIPTSLFRILVLNAENLHHLTEDFTNCKMIFKQLADLKNVELSQNLDQLCKDIEYFERDLKSRELRISFLKESLTNDYSSQSSSSRVADLRDRHMPELKIAWDEYDSVTFTHEELQTEEAALKSQIADQMRELVDTARKPFRRFLSSQNLTGDLVMVSGSGMADEEFLLWIKELEDDGSPMPPPPIEEIRQMWHSMSFERKCVAVTSLFTAFWEIADCLPFFVADLNSVAKTGFNLSEKALKVLYNVNNRISDCQFILSAPGSNHTCN